MKLTLPTKSLLETLDRLRPLFSARTTLPILSHVGLSAADDELTLTASNIDQHCVIRIPAHIESPGAIAVGGTRLLAALKGSVHSECSFSLRGKVLRMESGLFTRDLNGLTVDEMPQARIMDNPKSVEINGTVLSESIEFALPFVSDDSTRPVLLGVYVEGGADGLRFVATNGRMLAVRHIADIKMDTSAIIPTEACALMASLSGNVKFSVDESAIRLESDEFKLTCSRIEGTYPSFRNVIPTTKEQTIAATFAREEMMNAIAFVSQVFAPSDLPITKFDFGKKICGLHASIKDGDESTADVPCVTKGDEIKIVFDANYMRRVLRAFRHDEVTLLMRDGTSCAMVSHSGDTVVIMPARYN